MMRVSVLVGSLLLLFTVPALLVGQDCPFPVAVAVRDTLDPAGYYKQSRGDIWECITMDSGFRAGARRVEVVGDTTIDGSLFSIIEETSFGFVGSDSLFKKSHRLSYESYTDSTRTVLTQNGRTIAIDIPFDAPFKSCRSLLQVTGGYDQEFSTLEGFVEVFHDAPAIKAISFGLAGIETYAHGFGLVRFDGEVSAVTLLAYTRSEFGELGKSLEQQFVITANSPVEIRPQLNVLSLSVYPNPTSGRLTIHLRGGTSGFVRLVVQDVLGRRLDTVSEVLVGGNERFEYSMDGWAEGVYLLTLYDSGLPIDSKLLTLAK